MITAKLNGGLGNKMYQIAAAYSLAMENNDICAFNLNDKVSKQGNGAMTYKNNIFKNVDMLICGWEAEVIYKEKGLHYEPLPYEPMMQIEGYFQSEKYFARYKNDIINLFKNDSINKIIMPGNSIAIHVRRGDYLGTSTCRVLSLDYYKRALEHIDSKDSEIFIFSDDVPWCKNHFKGKNIRFSYGPDHLDLYKMSLCKYKIIANSSFSAWAAILGGGQVVAPLQWSVEMGTRDIYSDNWVVL